MRDPYFTWAERLLAEASDLSTSESARLIVDHYRVADLEGQLALVLALIAEVGVLRGHLYHPFRAD